MYCRHCGSDIELQSKFCPSCGKKLKAGKIEKTYFAVKKRIYALMNEIKSIINRTEMNYFKKYGLYVLVAVTVAAVLTTANIFALPYYKTRQYAKAKELMEEEKYEEAVEVFSSAQGIADIETDVYKSMGQAYLNLEDYENAKGSLEKSLALLTEEKDIDIYMLLAEVYLYEGDMKSYEEILLKMTEVFPNHSYAYLKLGYYYMDQKYFNQAERVLEELLKRETNEEATKLLYNVYLQSYRDNKAAEKVNSIKTSAYKVLSQQASFELLDVGEGECISVSPDGNYILILIAENNKKQIYIYSRNEGTYEFFAGFALPILFEVQGSEINWSNNEDKFVFYDASAEKREYDSYIYMYDMEEKKLLNLTDPKNTVMNYVQQYDFFIIDSNPVISEDGNWIYFARYSSGGNGLFSINTETMKIEKLYEPDNGARIRYRILEKNGIVYFSVAGLNNTPESGLYQYKDGDCEKLEFDYDDKFYYLALNDISTDGRYLMYYITSASQNNSFYFKVLDLKTMSLVNVYDQVIDYVGKEFTSVCRMDIFGERYNFICRNAVFSADGKSIILAEGAKDFAGQILRSIQLENGNSEFIYLYFDYQNSAGFSLNASAGGSAHSTLRQISEDSYLIYDEGLKVLHQ